MCLFFLLKATAHLAAMLITDLQEALEAMFFFLFLYLFSSLLSRVLDRLHLL